MDKIKVEPLIIFIRNFTHSKIEIDFDTRISEDLKIGGDDAYEFLMEYNRTFNVDISNFPYSEYFSHEGFSIIVMFFSLFKKEKLKVLKVGELYEGIVRGHL